MRQQLLPVIAIGFGLLSLSGLFCPALMECAAAQAPTSVTASDIDVTVNPLFRSLLPKLRTKCRIPILLPPDVPGQGRPLVTDLSVAADQYVITIHHAKAGQRLDFTTQVADISGLRLTPRSLPVNGRHVALAGSITGYYDEAQLTDPYASVEWRQGGCEYRIGLSHGTLAQLKTMADWAIQHPISSGRAITQ